MTAFRWNALDKADAYRATALRRREQSGSTVRLFATSAALARFRGQDAPTSDDESRARWEHAVSQFIEDMRFDLFGQDWEGLEL